jgi:hypothetical protein
MGCAAAMTASASLLRMAKPKRRMKLLPDPRFETLRRYLGDAPADSPLAGDPQETHVGCASLS